MSVGDTTGATQSPQCNADEMNEREKAAVERVSRDGPRNVIMLPDLSNLPDLSARRNAEAASVAAL